MRARVLPLVAVAVAAVGCSVLVNTDFTGGKEPAASNQAGQAGTAGLGLGGTLPGVGGTLGDGGMSEGGEAAAPAEGGVANEPGAPGGSSGVGGSATSGTGGTDGGAGAGEGGMGADEGTGGSAGTQATGGAGTGPTAGAGGAMGGAGTGGGSGTNAGMSGAGGMTCDADLTSDPMHCGTCATVCAAASDCIDSTCVSSPCDGICTTWTTPDNDGDGPRKTDLMSASDVCFQVSSDDPKFSCISTYTCWNTNPRQLDVNGTVLSCDNQTRPLTIPTRKGGYCVHATAGNPTYAGFVLSYASGCTGN